VQNQVDLGDNTSEFFLRCLLRNLTGTSSSQTDGCVVFLSPQTSTGITAQIILLQLTYTAFPVQYLLLRPLDLTFIAVGGPTTASLR